MTRTEVHTHSKEYSKACMCVKDGLQQLSVRWTSNNTTHRQVGRAYLSSLIHSQALM